MSWTKEQRQQYDKERYQRIRSIRDKQVKARRADQRQRLRDLKSTLRCERCGFSHPAALQFHHKNPAEKEFAIASHVSNGTFSWRRILNEISKCEVLCANCHAIEHDAFG